jgi:hypothetical protein
VKIASLQAPFELERFSHCQTAAPVRLYLRVVIGMARVKDVIDREVRAQVVPQSPIIRTAVRCELLRRSYLSLGGRVALFQVVL